MMTQFYHQRVQTNYTLHLFFIFLLLCSHYIADLIKKLELRLMIVSVLIGIKPIICNTLGSVLSKLFQQ